MKCDTQLWPSDIAFQQAMRRMLRAMNLCPSMSTMEIAPLCLSKDHLASLLSPDEREVNAMMTVDGWFDSFSESGDDEMFQTAISRWEKSLELIRNRLDWSKLPPAVHQQATRQANDLAIKARQEGFIERSDQGLHWKITSRGVAAIRDL